MAGVWRLTGPPENWITAISRGKWALNEKNRGLWESGIEEGDPLVLHSTGTSRYVSKPTSSIVGVAFAGERQDPKSDPWWIQEIEGGQNIWPYVIDLKECYLFSDIADIELTKSIDQKSDDQIAYEIGVLTKNVLKLSDLIRRAKELSPEAPRFPATGSASHINAIYEELIFKEREEFFETKPTTRKHLDEKITESVDARIAGQSKEKVLSDAANYSAAGESHVTKYGPRKIRKENQVQKRRIAALEDFTCQVCGFRQEYTRKNGKKGHIVEVDHIVDKADGGDESLTNLWVLCPNCHAKKTYGVIVVDVKEKTVVEDGREIKINDHHLFIR